MKPAPPLRSFFPAVLWFLFVLVLLCIPGKEIPESRITLPDADKLVHFFLFGIMAYLFCRPFLLSGSWSHSRKKGVYLFIMLAVSFWGLATEFIQKYWIPNRDFELLDWLADSLGAVAAFFFIVWKSAFSGQKIS